MGPQRPKGVRSQEPWATEKKSHEEKGMQRVGVALGGITPRSDGMEGAQGGIWWMLVFLEEITGEV